MNKQITPESTGEERLVGALIVLGYTGNEPSHHRYGLLHAIFMFAALGKDVEIQEVAEQAMLKIRAENARIYDNEIRL